MAVEANPEVLWFYGLCSSILALKMMLMSPLTGIFRIKNMTFANQEDASLFGAKVTQNDNVERVRRAHLNDVENIIPFFVLALLYSFTEPTVWHAKLLFSIYTVTRIGHSIVYIKGMMPSRFILFACGMACNLFMAMNILTYIHNAS